MPKAAVYEALVGSVVSAYDTVVSIVQAAAEKAPMVHNSEIENVDPDAIARMSLVICRKKQMS